MFPNPLEWIRIAGACFLIGLLCYQIGQVSGRAQGLKVAEARAAKATIEQLKERGLIDETVNNLDACDLLADLGVPDCGD